jgi:hypothetical protein
MLRSALPAVCDATDLRVWLHTVRLSCDMEVREIPWSESREWSFRVAEDLKRYTKRRIVVRDKESKKPLIEELCGAHALVTHGSIAAVEAVVMGCPVFVDRSSAAALMGLCDLERIESPLYPQRERWLQALAYSQFNEAELCDGTLWRLLE